MEGTSDAIKGRAKQAVGAVTDDDDLKREGQADETSGKVKNKVDDAKDWVEDKVDDVKDKFKKN